MELIHRTARECRSAFLWSEFGIHREAEASVRDQIRSEILNDFIWEEGDSGELRRLQAQRLQHDLFRSSAEALGLWLNPEAWVSFRFEVFDPKTGKSNPAEQREGGIRMVIVLPEADRRQSVEPFIASVQDLSRAHSKPRWDGRRLFVKGELIKEYSVPADNQRKILQAFEHADWEELIPDPLRRPNDRTDQKRLGDAIRDLNRSIRRRGIEFSRDGTGTSICWSWANPI